MSTDLSRSQTSPAFRAERPHPLQLVTPSEVSLGSSVVRKLVHDRDAANGTTTRFRFKSISLHDPPKALLLPYLDAEANGVAPSQRPYVPRCLEIIWSANNESVVTESIISLDARQEIAHTVAGAGQHGSNDRFEVRSAGERILAHPKVKDAVKQLHLADDVIIGCDSWMYGADRDSNNDTHKYIQGLLYARAPGNHPDSNQYSYPLPFSPLYDSNLDDVVRIVPLATGGKEDGMAYGTAPDHPMAHCEPNEYHQELLNETRKDLKPLQVVQPEGPSFTVTDGNCVAWQKWRFRVGFNFREGLTVHDVRYDQRRLFYRLSVSEMTVPYGGESSLG